MQGDPQVIQLLNDLVTGELTASHQYLLHARMCEDWGYERLYEKIHEESRDELNHADRLVERILFLEGVPDVQRMGTIAPGKSVHEQLQLDYALERGVVGALNRGIALSRQQGDNGTADLLEELLESTEEHAHWLESQLTLVAQIGIQNYLAEQIKKGGGGS
jgi:bacterioferritin